MPSYAGLLGPMGSKHAMLKSKFNAENFIHRLSWSIPSGFSAVLVMISGNSVSICNRSHARRVNSAKITIS